MTPEHLQRLHGALLSAFPMRSSLAQMLAFELGWQLDQITGAGNLRDSVFELLRHAEAQGQIDAVIQAACTANPGNLQLRDARAAILQGAARAEQGAARQNAATAPAARTPLKLIYGCASKDTRFAAELEKHLDILARAGAIEPPWSEARIAPGAVRGEEIKRRWQTADIIVLLVSADLMSGRSDLLTLAEDRMRAGATVVPVIIRPAMWQLSWIGHSESGLQVLPRDKGEVKPVSKWSEEADAWVDVIEGLQAAIAARAA